MLALSRRIFISSTALMGSGGGEWVGRTEQLVVRPKAEKEGGKRKRSISCFRDRESGSRRGERKMNATATTMASSYVMGGKGRSIVGGRGRAECEEERASSSPPPPPFSSPNNAALFLSSFSVVGRSRRRRRKKKKGSGRLGSLSARGCGEKRRGRLRRGSREEGILRDQMDGLLLLVGRIGEEEA